MMVNNPHHRGRRVVKVVMVMMRCARSGPAKNVVIGFSYFGPMQSDARVASFTYENIFLAVILQVTILFTGQTENRSNVCFTSGGRDNGWPWPYVPAVHK